MCVCVCVYNLSTSLHVLVLKIDIMRHVCMWERDCVCACVYASE